METVHSYNTCFDLLSYNGSESKHEAAAHTTGGPLSEDRLVSEIGIFFLAGFETTGHSGAWLLYLVSQHPQVEAKICQELDQHGLLVTADRPHPRKVTYDDLSKLSYLDMAIKVRR